MPELELQAHWKRLSEDAIRGGGNSGHFLTRLNPSGRWNFWLALRQPDGARALLMGLSSAPLPSDDELPNSRGFSAATTQVVPSGLGVSELLEVRLKHSGYSDVFDALIQNLVDAGEACAEELDALRAVLEQLRRWQSFVEKVPPEGLSHEARIGLFGELLVLRDYVALAWGVRRAVHAWQGPLGAHQDFQGMAIAVETKTTTSKKPHSIRITSELQLDDTGLDALMLAHVWLEEKHGAGEQLPTLVADIRSLSMDSGCGADFDARLYAAGYHDVHSPRYKRYGYVVRGINAYKVAPGFPRIVEGELQPGIGNVTYSIAVSECAPYVVATEELIQILSSGANG